MGGPYPPLNVPCGEKMTGLLPCENCFPKLTTDGGKGEREGGVKVGRRASILLCIIYRRRIKTEEQANVVT